ncbi:hypothetical protein [Chondrinema litorale]|uniref:hypothetical protein n=1 Tax=Chondrinema litorale TaxID=2994555 RepID=UPI0025427713|nr:hypothetical protein [Chondrinema litorale]UZR95165.1 hypothetical protein OQ292_04955 [Chondrinema litorale]
MVRIRCYTYIILVTLLLSYLEYGEFLDHQRELKHNAFLKLAEVHEKQSESEVYPYAEKLNTYFGSLNAKLIEKHYKDFYSINSDSSFYDFYKNSLTLKGALTSAVKKAMQNEEDSIQLSSDFTWFRYAAPSLLVITTPESYRVDIDYKLLNNISEKTIGDKDNVFLNIFSKSYTPDTHFPIWLSKSPDKKIYSKLGSGIHLKLLNEIEAEIKQETCFEKEFLKIKKLLVTDLLFSKNFEMPKQNVITELGSISEHINFNEKEKELLAQKIEKLKSQDDIFTFVSTINNSLSIK